MNRLNQYAELLVKVGVNIQDNQILVVSAPIETADFVREITKKAYESGAREVVIRWHDELSNKIRYDMGPDQIFDEVPEWVKVFFTDYSNQNAAFLSISASDPELMKTVDPKKISRQNKAMNLGLSYWRSRMMSNQNVWCVASIPTKAWAKKVFPKETEEKAVEKLWDSILHSVRADVEDPVAAWQKHQENLDTRIAFLHDKNFKYLKLRNDLGTNLTLALPDNHVWYGGGDEGPNGQIFFANMPTEEVFTVPHRLDVEGIVHSSMPLNYNGNLIDRFWFEFKSGEVVDFGAEEGLDVLKELLETDPGAKRLGEIALVPYDSPISNQQILFYNTLYDENASCHLALGRAYPTCLKDGSKMSEEQLEAAGANFSLTHVDFMVGTEDLSITGVQSDGTEVPVFVKGNFAFENDTMRKESV